MPVGGFVLCRKAAQDWPHCAIVGDAAEAGAADCGAVEYCGDGGYGVKRLLTQSKQDVTRLLNASDRITELRDAYILAMDDLRIAKQGLKTIATWASCPDTQRSPFDELQDIEDRAMDTLSLMFNKD